MEQLLKEELFLVDGGKNWWYIIGGGIMTLAGAAGAFAIPTVGGKLASGGVAVAGVTTIVDGWTAK